MACIGVLALQGGVPAHKEMLLSLGHRVLEVRRAGQFSSLDGLVLPGGESSAQWKLLRRLGLREPLTAFLQTKRPVLATCAGLILLAGEVSHPQQESLGVLDIAVSRNGWGRQLDSFEATDDSGTYPLVFIRAPRIIRVGPQVRVLATFRQEPILVQQGSITAATFHPELTPSNSLHRAAFGAA